MDGSLSFCVTLVLIVATVSGQLTTDALNAHNNYRRLHGAQNLVLAGDLTNYAQNWANHLANLGSMVHSSCMLNGKALGENIAMAWGTTTVDITGAQATKGWYDEVSKYNFNDPKYSDATGHFTQVVWKGTKEMGIAKAKANSKVFVVASYRPAGNYQGQFAANVGRKA